MNIENSIICGNCIDIIKKEIKENSVDLIITSPPYNCGINYDIYDDNKNWKDYLLFSKEWLLECKRVLKKDGRICVNILMQMKIKKQNLMVSPFAEFYQLFKEIGITPFAFPVWADNHRVKYTSWGSWLSVSSPYIYNPYEVILIGYKEQWHKINKGISTITKDEFITGCSGVYKLRNQTKELTKANFHTDLSDLCIKLLSYENDLILNPFAGSATTCVSAKNLNRRYIGIELSDTYCKIAKERLNSLF